MPGRVLSKETVSESDGVSDSQAQSSSESDTTSSASSKHSPSFKRQRDAFVTRAAKRVKVTSSTASELRPVALRSDNSSSNSGGDGDTDTSSNRSAQEKSSDTLPAQMSQNKLSNGQSIHTDVNAVQQVTRKPYQPPNEYERIEAMQSQDVRLQDILSSTDLTNKQLWYITAPASLTISSVPEMDLAILKSDEAVLKHAGVHNRIVSQDAGNMDGLKLLRPDRNARSYVPVTGKFARVLNVQSTVGAVTASGLTGIAENESHIQGASTSINKALRQPDGLKMRFWPCGFEPEPSSNAESSPASLSSDSEFSE